MEKLSLEISRFDEDSRRAAAASHRLYVESVEAPFTLTIDVDRDQNELVLADNAAEQGPAEDEPE